MVTLGFVTERTSKPRIGGYAFRDNRPFVPGTKVTVLLVQEVQAYRARILGVFPSPYLFQPAFLVSGERLYFF
jgi:hypothetical protein